eukprot:scaffold7893_cov69-Cyclotella_meneghiniana.AAC.2
MSETGNIGESANDLSYQAREETNEGGNQNETYETKLKDGPGSSCVGHKKLLSEQFDDLLSITPQGVTNHSRLVENLGAVATATSEAASQHDEKKPAAVETIEPKRRFANATHLSFEPPTESDTATTAPNDMYHSTNNGLSYPYYQLHSAGDQAAPYFAPPPPPVLTPGSSESRKHRRELSEHHPMTHRRKNTLGESESTRWSYNNNEEVEDAISTIQENQDCATRSDYTFQPTHHSYSLHGHPQDYYSGFATIPIVNRCQSDSGVAYAAQQQYSFDDSSECQEYQSYTTSLKTGGQYESGSSSHHRKLSSLSAFMHQDHALKPGDQFDGNGSNPHHRTLSSLSAFSFPEYAQNQGFQSYITSLKSGDQDDSDNSNSHHRKQSSLSAFLATPNLFEDVYHEMERDGYHSAPDNIEENEIQANHEPIVSGDTNVCSSSCARSLSEDTFFQQFYRAIHDEHTDDNLDVKTSGQPNHTACYTTPTCIPITNHARQLVLKQQPVEVNYHRRKCAVANCPNRVVQGGLCISHGAKRKTCNFPGCTKNVKKQGKCSAHGPERKRCEAEGCTKVAVQGGKCISHGAKKKCCAVEGCIKQSIIRGMCKRHHDEYCEFNGIVKTRAPRKPKGQTKKPTVDQNTSSPGFDDHIKVDTTTSSASPTLVNVNHQN